jgi:predicted Zn-dependent peptidase
VRLDWLEPIEPLMLVRYRIPGVGHPDRPVFDVVARLLRGADGRLAGAAPAASRGVDWQANASSAGSQNTLTMQARAARDEDLPALEKTALDGIERLHHEAVDEARLARVRREFRLDWEMLRSERGGLATQFGSFAIADDWRTLQSHYEARNTATAQDILRVAAKYLVPWNRVIATTRRTPQPRAERNTASARPISQTTGGQP